MKNAVYLDVYVLAKLMSSEWKLSTRVVVEAAKPVIRVCHLSIFQRCTSAVFGYLIDRLACKATQRIPRKACTGEARSGRV